MRFSVLVYSKGFKQKDLAKELGVSQQLVSKWCSHKCKPQEQSINQMATIFGISVEKVIKSLTEK